MPTRKTLSINLKSSGKATWSFYVASEASAGERVALHKAAGEITLAQMLHEWALHDLGHIRQIAELARARRYLAGAGPLGKDYDLRP